MDYKDLDIILSLLNSNKDSTEMQLIHNQYKMKSLVRFSKFTEEKLRLILNKLESDKYVDFMMKDDIRYYYINYNGIEFLEQGGYAEKLRLQKLKEDTNKRENVLIQIATVGSVIVGAYYLLLLIKDFFCPFLSFLFCH